MTLPPLPEFASEFRPRWEGDSGGYSAAQMQAYAAAAVAAEREACAKLCDTARERYDATGASVAMARALAEDIRARVNQA